MAIMAMQDQGDARGAAWVLANTAKRCIDDFAYTPADKIALNGVFKLLKAYRMHRLTAFEYQPRASRSPEAFPALAPSQRHIGELRAALSNAINTTYHGLGEDAALEAVESVFRSLAQKQKAEQEQVRRTSAFLDCLTRNLQPAR